MRVFVTVILSFLLLAGFQCKKSAVQQGCFKGKLVKKGICMNYTISVVSGNIDTSLVAETWQDPTTGVSYDKAFGLGSPCNFPDMAEGAEFYFTIGAPDQECAVCMAFYPTPDKKLAITVVDGPCD
ncbi:MAG TPA: hypothetical protein VFZ78_04710 [Flavisolibacter sp.]